MRVAINAVDNAAVIDGKAGTTDCADLVAKEISAVQWFEDHGEVEYVGHAKPNEKITDFAPFQSYVDDTEFPVELTPTPPPAGAKDVPREAPVQAPVVHADALMFEFENRLRQLEGQSAMSENEFIDKQIVAWENPLVRTTT